MNLHGVQESSCCACCCVLFSRDNNRLRILPWYGRQEEESVFKYLLECACLESQGLRYMKKDPVLETMGTNGLYHLNRSRKTHLYRSNHVKKTLLKKTNRREWMLTMCCRKCRLLETWLLPSWSSCKEMWTCWLRPSTSYKWPTGPALSQQSHRVSLGFLPACLSFS